MQKSIRGFTLIELMIVVAIIGILAAIAIPAYRDYIARAQAAEAFSLLSGAKTPLGEFFAETGRWPTTIGSVTNAGTAGKYIATVSISGGANTSDPIELTAQIRNTNVSSLLAGKSILLTSTAGSTWTCKSDNLRPDLLPLACR